MPPTWAPSRSRLLLACGECKRLKLKCDKNKPCSSCVRRGCASICPQGRMVSKGSRFILANTEQLHEKIDALISRVRQLEHALETSHSRHSRETHPLLEEELRLIATPLEAVAPEADHVGKEDELAECVGTLTLDKRGTRYFGSTGDFAFVWQDKDGPDGAVNKRRGEVSLALADLPTEVADMAHSFPIRIPTFDVSHLSTWILENCLPPSPEAWSLFENYWEHYASQFTPITRVGFVERILSPLYNRSPDHGDEPLGHRLGLLFIVLAIGDLLDLTQPWVPSRGLRYYLLARASLCLDPVLESPTVTALQAMHLLGIFIMMSRGTNEPEHAWILSGINVKLAFTLGLQHDANKFNLPQVEVESRRYLVISLISAELWQALSIGRPPSQTFANFDWVFPPKLQHSDAPQDSSTYSLYRHWMIHFIRDCTSQVVDTVIGHKVTNYNAILQLDAKIREYPIPLPMDVSKGPDELGTGTVMQRTYMSILKDIAFLFLHRRGFALALRDYPNNPLKSPFAPSVVACHRSAMGYVSKISLIYSAAPALTLRMWYIWPNVFVATLVLGSIVARSPGCSLASSSLLCLEEACQLWATVSDAVCSGKVLEIVRQLEQKAFLAFAQNQDGDMFSPAPGGIEALDEIHALGGYGPRVMSMAPKSTSSTSSLYIPGSKDPKGPSDSSQTALPRNRSDDYIPSHTYDKPVDVPFSTLSAANSVVDLPPSAAVPFDGDNFDYSAHLPTSSDNTPRSDFDDVFYAMGDTAPHTPQSGFPLLEELGLGGEWQPVMDHLGL